MKELFIHFLKVNNAYNAFLRNCKALGRNGKKFIAFHTFNRQDATSAIFYAFYWDQTPEGGEYWGKLHLKWREYIRKRVELEKRQAEMN